MVAMSESEAEAGDAVPTRKKKEVPQHVQEILQQDSMAENVLEQLPTLQDFEPVRKVTREDPGSKAPPKIIKTELYVRGIPYEMDNDGLKELFKVHKPRSSRVMKDKQGRRPLGFGFVTFYNEFKAAEAMAAMNGFAVRNERGIETQLVISYATEKKVKVKNRDLSTVSMTEDNPALHADASGDAMQSRQRSGFPDFFRRLCRGRASRRSRTRLRRERQRLLHATATRL
jgi:RNA recognition motif-containing protein